MKDKVKVEEKINKKKIIIGGIIVVIIAALVFSIGTCSRRNVKFHEIVEPAGIPEAAALVDNVPFHDPESEITIFYQGSVKKIIVTFNLHTNDHHPLGYVIIKEIKVNNIGETEIYKILYEGNEYIENIHSDMSANAKVGIVRLNGEILGDELFRVYFRTAEAMIMVYNQTHDGDIQTVDLKKAKERMTGRQTGKKL